jgi:phosphoglycerate kinase
MNLITMCELDLHEKRLLIREDLNVPIINGLITSDQRIQAALPTLITALQANAAVIVLSHLGRPEEGLFNEEFSLQPVAEYLQEQLDFPVRFVQDYLDGVDCAPGELVLCENARFNYGERACDDKLAKKLAKLCDIFVMDAFGTAHRKHASTYGVAKYAKIAAAGPLLIHEITELRHVLKAPKKPIIAIVGGAKISSKLSLLKKLIRTVDVLILGGGIANTFLKAQGHEIGVSMCEDELLDEARQILQEAKSLGCEIPLPSDVVVGKAFTDTCPAYNKSLNNIAIDDMVMDIGPDTINRYINIIHDAETIIWNGPLGVFEFAQFSYGTGKIAMAISKSHAISVAGGGDTLAAIDKYNLSTQITYISTGGGAFLEYLQNNTLPAIDILEERALNTV